MLTLTFLFFSFLNAALYENARKLYGSSDCSDDTTNRWHSFVNISVFLLPSLVLLSGEWLILIFVIC